MTLRQAGGDPRSAPWFWGCSRFPHCRGMLSAPQPAPRPRQPEARPAPRPSASTPSSATRWTLRLLALALLVITLAGIALIGSLPALVAS